MSEPKYVNAIFKAASILGHFTSEQPVQSAAVIARKTGLPVSTARRIMNTLAECGLLDRNEGTSSYSIGASMYILGSLYLSATDIFAASQPVIATLNEMTGETISVSLLRGGDIVLIMKEEARGSFRLTTHVGSVIPAYATAMGKALLSELTDAEIDALYPGPTLTPVNQYTVTSKELLKAQLADVRRNGLAFSSQESYEGVEAFACLVRDHTGVAAGALSITIPVFRMNGSLRERLLTIVRLGADLVSHRLGYNGTSSRITGTDELRSWWNRISHEELYPAQVDGTYASQSQ